MNLKNKQELIEKFGANAKDTGSTEVQIAMLTKKISELTEHMKANKKDFATKRGLLMMVGKRKRLLSYLKDRNLDGYRSLIKELGENDYTPEADSMKNLIKDLSDKDFKGATLGGCFMQICDLRLFLLYRYNAVF